MQDRIEYPERIIKYCSEAYAEYSQLWKSFSDMAFESRVINYLAKVVSRLQSIVEEKEAYKHMISVYWPPLDDVIAECPEEHSFSSLTTTWKFLTLAEILIKFNESMAQHLTKQDSFPMERMREELTTAVIARFSDRMLDKYRNPIYVVADDLEWALLNTELKNYPSDSLRLPFPAIYIALPRRFQVYHWQSGWHQAEGAYIVEDNVPANRSWRIMAVGQPKEHPADDALFHFTIELPSGSTIEEALGHTFGKFNAKEPSKIEVIEVGGFKREVVRGYPSAKYHDEYAVLLKAMIPIFRYIMNVVLYVTTSEADSRMYNASKEYRLLKDRALKAKGEKRKKLFGELKGMAPCTRILLGKDLVIDRKKEASDGEGDETGRKLTKRFLVTGHWHLYHVGEGRTKSVTKWIQPYWKGPQEALLTPERRRKVR